MYQLEVSPSASRDLNRLRERIRRQDFEQLRATIKELGSEPRPYGVRKIKGTVDKYRIRVGHYRIVYKIQDKEKLVLLLQVVRRSESTYKA
ncbi:MAG: type II toxin-antitoxin system RelE/ParE family toxin [Chloroflexi bacterium]|nr:type II toxin-antitoxin system RelE/ParE family toxin [Chloroflexota bacterium]